MFQVGFPGFISKLICALGVGRRERENTGCKQKQPDTKQEYGFVAENLLSDFVGHGFNADGADCLGPV